MYLKKKRGQVESNPSSKKDKSIQNDVKMALKSKNESVLKLQIYRLSLLTRKTNPKT